MNDVSPLKNPLLKPKMDDPKEKDFFDLAQGNQTHVFIFQDGAKIKEGLLHNADLEFTVYSQSFDEDFCLRPTWDEVSLSLSGEVPTILRQTGNMRSLLDFPGASVVVVIEPTIANRNWKVFRSLWLQIGPLQGGRRLVVDGFKKSDGEDSTFTAEIPKNAVWK